MLDPTTFLDNVGSREGGKKVDAVNPAWPGISASRWRRQASIVGVILPLAIGISGVARPTGNGNGSDAYVAPLPPIARETCEEARERAGIIPDDDVRFVECDRTKPTKGEAFSLGDPVYVRPGPSAVDARIYSPGHCEDGGGAITEHSIFYKPEHVGIAIGCSRARCQRRDARGCRDLGALNWDDEFLPGVKKDETQATAAFRSGCELGDAKSCSSLAQLFDTKHDAKKALELYAAACNAPSPNIIACHEVGERLLKARRDGEAKSFLLRACRGTTRVGSPYEARREGCSLLADMAERRGDLASKWEYLRLECAYGYRANHACDRYGLMLLRQGEKKRALPYLHTACGVLPADKIEFAEACDAESRLTRELENGER